MASDSTVTFPGRGYHAITFLVSTFLTVLCSGANYVCSLALYSI